MSNGENGSNDAIQYLYYKNINLKENILLNIKIIAYIVNKYDKSMVFYIIS